MSAERDLSIQRLVDGQLNRDQTRQLLQTAQTQPELWREIAVAYVEDQIFASQSRQFAHQELGVPRKALPRAARRSWSPAASRWGVHLSTAAMLLVAIGLGFLLGRNELMPPAGRSASDSPNRMAQSPPSSSTSPYVLQLVDNQGVPIPEAAYPVFTEEEAQRLGYRRKPLEIPPSLQNQFRKAGWELEPETKIVEYELDDGRRLALPLRNIKLRSYGQ